MNFGPFWGLVEGYSKRLSKLLLGFGFESWPLQRILWGMHVVRDPDKGYSEIFSVVFFGRLNFEFRLPPPASPKCFRGFNFQSPAASNKFVGYAFWSVLGPCQRQPQKFFQRVSPGYFRRCCWVCMWSVLGPCQRLPQRLHHNVFCGQFSIPAPLKNVVGYACGPLWDPVKGYFKSLRRGHCAEHCCPHRPCSKTSIWFPGALFWRRQFVWMLTDQ